MCGLLSLFFRQLRPVVGVRDFDDVTRLLERQAERELAFFVYETIVDFSDEIPFVVRVGSNVGDVDVSAVTGVDDSIFFERIREVRVRAQVVRVEEGGPRVNYRDAKRCRRERASSYVGSDIASG